MAAGSYETNRSIEWGGQFVVTASKRWAIVSGFVITAVAIVVATLVARSDRTAPGAATQVSLATAPPIAVGPPKPAATAPGPGTTDPSTAAGPAVPNPPAAGSTGSGSTGSGSTGSGSVAVKVPAPDAAGTTIASLGDRDQPSARPAALGAGDPSTTPHFDVVRVEPNGDTVLAGQGAPNVTMELMAAGTVLAQVATDATGHFVMLPPALAPGDYALTLRQPVEGRPALSAQSVTVSVPGKGKGPVVVALAEPGQATKLLSGAPVAGTSAPQPAGAAVAKAPAVEGSSAAPSAGPPSALAIRSVELENGNGFYASGVAAPGTRLRVYLNNSHLADVVAGAGGSWSVKIRKGLLGGHYVVRADASGQGAGIAARVEVPFDVPVDAAGVAAAAPPMPAAAAAAAVASAPIAPAPVAPAKVASTDPVPVPRPVAASAPVATPAPLSQPVPAAPPRPAQAGVRPPAVAPAAVSESTAAQPAAVAPVRQAVADPSSTATDAVIDEVKTAVVRTGDNLWDISRIRLGQGWRYTRIYAANVTQIRDPRLIYPGQVFVLPSQND